MQPWTSLFCTAILSVYHRQVSPSTPANNDGPLDKREREWYATEMNLAEEDDYALPLSASHRDKLFRQSGISPEVAAARGYQTVTKESHAAAYRENGWTSLVPRLPALEIPLWTTEGRAVWPQLRPDEPRVRSGKPVKYEMPAGETLRLDVNPILSTRIKGTEPLVITEGILKADAGISKGLCTIGLLGVYGFRGRNAYGGLTALADWQNINLRGRDVFLAFDSDLVTKPQVQSALTALRTYLGGKGSNVFTVYLPEGPEHTKVGLDDYLLNHSAADFWALAQADPDPSTLPVEDAHAVEFEVRNGAISMLKMTDDGRVATPLCNFTATITSVGIRDDGMNATREFRICGTNARGAALPSISVPADEYDQMDWVTEQWGGRAVIAPGRALKDALRAAIIVLSTKDADLPEKLIYTHVGWRKIDEEWCYLSTSGALGATALHDDIVVDPDGPLANVELVAPDAGTLGSSVRKSLCISDIAANDSVMPVLAAAYLAPLAEILHPNFVVHLVGHTGSLKTETAALMQGHFGRNFNAQAMPGSWLSTANYMERQAFAAKDCIIVMDDFRPNEGQGGLSMHQKAETFIRGVGNVAGRGRLNADATAKRVFHSRGLVVSTGEDAPQGESLRARMALVEMSRHDIDLRLLSIAQANRDSGALVEAMSGYIQWLSPQLDELRTTLRRRHLEILDEYNQSITSLRTPFVCAYLYLAFELFCSYATQVRAIDAGERAEYLARAKRSIMQALPAQSAAIAEEDEVHRFLDIIKSGFLDGRCHLRGMRSLGWEDGLESFGWVPIDGGDRKALGRMVGYVDFAMHQVLLIPESAYAYAHEAASRAGHGISISKTRLWKNMIDSKFVEAQEQGHSTVRRVVPSGDRVRLLLLSPRTITVRTPHTDDQAADAFEENLETNS